MKRFAEAYPSFPIWQVPLAKLKELPILQATLAKLESEGKGFVQVPLAQITWYHHISLLSKVKDIAERAYYITETAQNGWSRDVMLMQIANGYIQAKGHAINNFEQTLPPLQSDLARYIFKDPYNFFIPWYGCAAKRAGYRKVIDKQDYRLPSRNGAWLRLYRQTIPHIG